MTLRKLADRLGLSQTTVSRALNGYPEVSEATRSRVLAEAARMRYAPDARARSLATGRAMAVGHVIPETWRHEMLNPVFADFIAGAGSVYEAAGYDMLLSLVSDNDEDRAYRGLAARGRVDGLIVQAPRQDDPRIALLRALGVPFVVHGRASEGDRDYSWIDMDNASAFGDATRHLLELGHRRIALLNGPEQMNFSQMRLAGYRAALQEAGVCPDPDLVRHAPMSESFGHDTAAALLDGPLPPTAILTSSLLIALGVRRAAEERGQRLGRDLSVVTHDDDLSYLPNGTPEAPLFTATRVSIPEAGREAAKMLLALVADPARGPIHRLQATQFVAGPSTGPAPT